MERGINLGFILIRLLLAKAVEHQMCKLKEVRYKMVMSRPQDRDISFFTMHMFTAVP